MKEKSMVDQCKEGDLYSSCEEEDSNVEMQVGRLLVEKQYTISTAESCTGGLLAGRLINYSGISSSFLEGAITYSNEAKIKRLGVKEVTVEKFGAVSEETAREMAIGIAKLANADIGISITGIAGPGGGTVEKPVGLVYVGIYVKGTVEVKKLELTGDRQQIRNQTVTEVLYWLKAVLI